MAKANTMFLLARGLTTNAHTRAFSNLLGDVGRNKRSAVQAIALRGVDVPELR
jgi:hypothetical protein